MKPADQGPWHYQFFSLYGDPKANGQRFPAFLRAINWERCADGAICFAISSGLIKLANVVAWRCFWVRRSSAWISRPLPWYQDEWMWANQKKKRVYFHKNISVKQSEAEGRGPFSEWHLFQDRSDRFSSGKSPGVLKAVEIGDFSLEKWNGDSGLTLAFACWYVSNGTS